MFAPHEEEYADYLNDQYPLAGINCNAFSILLKEGDPIAYSIGFDEWLTEHHPEGEEMCEECGDTLYGDEETLCSSCEEYARKAKP